MTQQKILMWLTLYIQFSLINVQTIAAQNLIHCELENFNSKQFFVAGRPAFILLPLKSNIRNPQPWVLYAPVVQSYPNGQETWMFEQLTKHGIAIAGVDVGESYGNPDGQKIFDQLYDELTLNRGFAKMPCLFARSRGGLWVANWAANNPEKVAGIAGIYPAFDLRSYPGLDKAAPAYGMTTIQLNRSLSDHNPIMRASILVDAKISVYLLHGDQDSVVPLEANSGALIQCYEKAGASNIATLQVAKGKQHGSGPEFFRSQRLVDFIIKCANSRAREVKKSDLP